MLGRNNRAANMGSQSPFPGGASGSGKMETGDWSTSAGQPGVPHPGLSAQLSWSPLGSCSDPDFPLSVRTFGSVPLFPLLNFPGSNKCHLPLSDLGAACTAHFVGT